MENWNINMFVFQHIGFLYMLQNQKSEYSMFCIGKHRSIDLFVFEHVQFLESEILVIQKHRTYNFCNRKCRKSEKYAFLSSQNVNKLNMYFSSNVVYSNVSTDQKYGNNIKINATNAFPISAFENQKSEQYTCEKIWYEFFHLGSLICLNLSLY